MTRQFCDMCGDEFDKLILPTVEIGDEKFDICERCQKRLIKYIDSYERETFNSYRPPKI